MEKQTQNKLHRFFRIGIGRIKVEGLNALSGSNNPNWIEPVTAICERRKVIEENHVDKVYF